jgi:hypothetical protein
MDDINTLLVARPAGTLAPGYELAYAEITATVNVVSTTEATGTLIVTAPAFTADGSSPVVVEFFSPALTSPAVAGGYLIVSLFEGATQIGRMGAVVPPTAANLAVPAFTRRRFTPSAGSHTYSITAVVSGTTGTPSVGAGVSGTVGYMPAYIRITRA